MYGSGTGGVGVDCGQLFQREGRGTRCSQIWLTIAGWCLVMLRASAGCFSCMRGRAVLGRIAGTTGGCAVGHGVKPISKGHMSVCEFAIPGSWGGSAGSCGWVGG